MLMPWLVGCCVSQNEYKSLAFSTNWTYGWKWIVVNGQLVRGMDHLAGEVALLPLT